MNLSIIKEFLKHNSVFYLIGFLTVFGLKLFYSQAGSDELIWILAPTTWWVSILSGIPFTYEPGMGYVNHSLRYIIAPSCSGVQFMIIIIATLIFPFVHRMGIGNQTDARSENLCGYCTQNTNKRKCFRWISCSILAAYPLTVFINGLRIILAIYLPEYLESTYIYHRFLTPESLHTIIGTVVYFISLLMIYRLADYIFLCSFGTSENRRTPLIRRFLPAVCWYFFIVLGIPFLNGVAQKNASQFTEYAKLILSVCGCILVIYVLASILPQHLKSTIKNGNSYSPDFLPNLKKP